MKFSRRQMSLGLASSGLMMLSGCADGLVTQNAASGADDPSTDSGSSRATKATTSLTRIMLMGDAIMLGSAASGGVNEAGHVSPRGFLASRLRSAGVPFQFLGPINNPVRSRDWASWSASWAYATIGPDGTGNNLYNRLSWVFGQNPPDIVIAMIGMENLNWHGTGLTNLAGVATNFMNQIRSRAPQARVVWVMPPRANWYGGAQLDAYNALATAGEQWAAAHANQFFLHPPRDHGIDMATDAWDGNMLSESGARKYADAMYALVTRIISGGTGSGVVVGGGAAPAPAPAPAPTPAVPSGTVWSSAEVEEAIRLSTGANEGPIRNAGNQGWARGAGVVMGNDWNPSHQPSGWTWPVGNYPNQAWSWFNWWGVLFAESNNATDQGWIEVAEMDWQVLYNGANQWSRVQGKQNSIGWINNFAADLINNTGSVPGMRAGAERGVSIQMPNWGSPHWMTSAGAAQISNPGNIRGILCSAMVRIDPRGNQNVRALIHVGGDPKPTNRGNGADGVPWYPGVGYSAAMRITSQWRRVTFVNVSGGNDGGQTWRTIPQSTLRSIPPLR